MGWRTINEPEEHDTDEEISGEKCACICERLAKIEEMLAKIVAHYEHQEEADDDEIVIGYHERRPIM